MIRNGVMIDLMGTVIDVFSWTRGQASPKKLGGGRTLILLKQDQIGVVQIGWRTLDGGETFSP